MKHKHYIWFISKKHNYGKNEQILMYLSFLNDKKLNVFFWEK